MPDEVLLVVLVVMAIGVGWKWAKNRIDEKKWRETSLTPEFRSRDFKGKNLGLKWEGEAGSG
jgi:hypothetical protein